MFNVGYDDIRHLPDYVFSEKLELLRKIHSDLSVPLVPKIRVMPPSRCKRKTPPKTCLVSPSLCNVSHKSPHKTSACLVIIPHVSSSALCFYAEFQ